MKHSVLIVEDDQAVRESLARALSGTYRMYKAANGREAMNAIQMNSDISVVISDLEMPEVDGFELLEKIRTDKRNVNVIIVSGSLLFESVDAMRMGAFDYMRKPVDLQLLETTIESAIHQRYDGKVNH